MKTLVGIVTFDNIDFTKLTVESMKNTTKKHEIDFFLVVGKPDDTETIKYLEDSGIPHCIHDMNYGFPKSINDIYDYAWVYNSYDYLIIAGNDIVAYPGTIDSLIDLANSSKYEVISALQYDVKSLLSEHPETQKFFSSDEKLIFTDFSSKPWELYKPSYEKQEILDMSLMDIQNLCLYKKSVFDKVGYTDVNFYPAYFIDNDYAMRLVAAKIKTCTLASSRFFHFWSRTIHQGSGGSTNHFFENNRKYYKIKWGGLVGSETKTPPIKIDSREGELGKIYFWRNVQ